MVSPSISTMSTTQTMPSGIVWYVFFFFFTFVFCSLINNVQFVYLLPLPWPPPSQPSKWCQNIIWVYGMFFFILCYIFCLLICDIHNSVTSSPTTTIQHIVPTSHPIWPSPASKKCQQLVQQCLTSNPPNCRPNHEARSVLSLHWKKTVPRKPSKMRRMRNSKGKEIEGGPWKSSQKHGGQLQSPL